MSEPLQAAVLQPAGTPAPRATPATPPGARQGQPRSSDLMAALQRLEAAHPVSEWRAGSTPLWPLLRVRWFFAEWARCYTEATPGEAGGGALRARLEQMARGARAASAARKADPAGNDQAPPARDLVFLSDGLSFSKVGERWVERFCDPLIQLGRERGLSSALWTPLHTYHRPRHSPSRFVQAGVDLCNLTAALSARLRPPALHLPAHARAVSDLEALGHGAAELHPRRIATDAARIISVAGHYRRLLQRARPRLAFVVSYYSLEGMAFVLACRQLGIPVVDLQHGVQGEHHPAYAAWGNSLQGGLHPLLPDRFWVWSPWEAEVIARWSTGSRHAPVVGANPWAGLWAPGSAWPGVGEATAAAQALKARANGRPVALVTLQFGLAPAEQIEPLLQVVRSLGEQLAFWVRLHPVMLERREEIRQRLAAAGPAELDACTDIPLQALLPEVDVHWTHSSSTVIDAAQFGVPSVIGSAFGAELFTPLVDSGVAVVEPGDAAAQGSTLLRLARRSGLQSQVALEADNRQATAFDALLAHALPRQH